MGDGKKSSKVVHVNMTKPYYDPSSRVLRTMVVAEDREECEISDRISTECEMGSEGKELEKVIAEFKDIITPVPGHTPILEHSILTGDSQPIRSPPHATSAVKAEAIGIEIEQLLEGGIIRPSMSPWASAWCL